jgi:hypothetical protein
VEVLSAMFDAVAKRSNAKFPQSRANPYSSINIPNTVQNSPLQFKELHYVILPQPDLFRGLGDSQPSNMAERTTSEEPSFTRFTKAERIEQLNEIDKSITALLQSAGLALQTLSSSSSRSHSKTYPIPIYELFNPSTCACAGRYTDWRKRISYLRRRQRQRLTRARRLC